MLPLPILFEDDLDETIILDSDDNENVFQFRDAAAVTTNWPMNSDCDGDGVSDGVDWNGDGAMNQFCMPATLGDMGLSIDINEDGEIDIAALEGCDVDPSNNEATTVNRPPISKPNGPYIEECQGAVTHVQLCSRLEIQGISEEAAEQMAAHRVGAIPFVDAGELKEIFTERKLVNHVVSKELHPQETRLWDVMT